MDIVSLCREIFAAFGIDSRDIVDLLIYSSAHGDCNHAMCMHGCALYCAFGCHADCAHTLLSLHFHTTSISSVVFNRKSTH